MYLMYLYIYIYICIISYVVCDYIAVTLWRSPPMPRPAKQEFGSSANTTSAPAEGPAHGPGFARRCEFPLRALQAQRWHVDGSSTFGAA